MQLQRHIIALLLATATALLSPFQCFSAATCVCAHAPSPSVARLRCCCSIEEGHCHSAGEVGGGATFGYHHTRNATEPSIPPSHRPCDCPPYCPCQLERADQPLALGTRSIDVRHRAGAQTPRTDMPRRPPICRERAATIRQSCLIRFVISSQLCAVLCRQTK